MLAFLDSSVMQNTRSLEAFLKSLTFFSLSAGMVYHAQDDVAQQATLLSRSSMGKQHSGIQEHVLCELHVKQFSH